MTKPRASARGQTLVEYALLLPVLLLILVVLFDMGRAVYYYSVIHNAAREGARYGIISPTNTGGIEVAARNLAQGLDPTKLNVSSSVIGATIRVIVTYSFEPATPLVSSLLSGGVVTLQTVSTMYIEQ